MKSWKTTLGGLLAAAGQFVGPMLPADLHWIGPALTGMGVLIMGTSARDNKVSTAEARK
jgi:hypothetical protein